MRVRAAIEFGAIAFRPSWEAGPTPGTRDTRQEGHRRPCRHRRAQPDTDRRAGPRHPQPRPDRTAGAQAAQTNPGARPDRRRAQAAQTNPDTGRACPAVPRRRRATQAIAVNPGKRRRWVRGRACRSVLSEGTLCLPYTRGSPRGKWGGYIVYIDLPTLPLGGFPLVSPKKSALSLKYGVIIGFRKDCWFRESS